MKSLNDPFLVEQNDVELTIDLGADKGKFTLQRDMEHNQLIFLSPVSGVNKYQYHSEDDRWLSIASDKHDLVGILTRDLIRVCVGCPQI